MRALFISFPASDYAASKRFYEEGVGLTIQREYSGLPHRFTNYDLGGMLLKVYEWTVAFHGSGHSGLFVETGDLDVVVGRICGFGGGDAGYRRSRMGRSLLFRYQPFWQYF